MKKKRKNPLIGAVFMLVIAAALVLLSKFVLVPHFQKEKESEDKSALLWKDAKRDKFLEISIKTQERNFSLKKNGEGKDWIVEASGKTFDGDSTAIDSLISTLLGTKKEDNVAIEPGKAGLDVPVVELKIIYSNDKDQKIENTLQLGEDSPVDYLTYAKWAQDPQIFMISKSLKTVINKKEGDFRNKKIIHYNLADLKAIQILGKKPYSLELGDAGKWFINTGKRKLAADTSSVSDWVGTLNNVRAVSFAAEDKSAPTLAKYGLAKPTNKIVFETLKGEKIEWIFGAVKPGKGSKEKETHVYAANSKTESIYEMPTSILNEAEKDYSDLRNKRLTTVEKAKIEKIAYASKDLSMVLKKEGAVWTGTHTYKGETTQGPAINAQVQKILNSLAVTRAIRFIEKNPKDPLLGLGKAKIELFEAADKSVSTLEIGNKTKEGEYFIWSPSFEDPAISLLAYEDLFPQKSEKIIEKKVLEKTPPAGASSSSTGQKKIMKLEKTVNSPKDLKKLPGPIVEKGVKYTVVFNFANGRVLKGVFDSDKAPYTVSNFIHLARNHFYDGTVFHRVIKDFVDQGGDPTGTGRGGPGWMFNNEDNDLRHLRGSLSMAHAGRDTNGSQFFIVLQPQPHLDGLHTVFGHLTEGVDGLDEIKQGDALATVEVFQEK